uniref:Glutathione peroxidase n=1 Tax=Leptobrachium leishanense TaxID=445787 RepID=A0A8C5LS24_9ANUR
MGGLAKPKGAEANWKSAKTIYEFSAKDIDGNQVSLEKYKYCICSYVLITNINPQLSVP